MSFFNAPKKKKGKAPIGVATLHRLECRACPLNAVNVDSPKMAPSGPDNAEVYVLGKYPTPDDDYSERHFTGDIGRILQSCLPHSWKREIRFNNIVRTLPVSDSVRWTEIECCRPSIIADIEKVKPKIIIPLGDEAITWCIPESTAYRWRGRMTPIKIGNHVCWLFPTLDPEIVFEKGAKRKDKMSTDEGRCFRSDLTRAFDVIENLPEPYIPAKDEIKEGLVWVTGHKKDDLKKVKKWLSWASVLDDVGLDIETNGLRPYRENTKILSMAIGTFAKTFAFPIDHKEAGWSEDDRLELDHHIKKFLEKSKCIKVAHKLDFEMEWLSYFYGNKLLRSSPWGDSMAQAYVLDERKKTHSLDFLCQLHFGLPLKSITDLDIKNLDNEPLEEVLEYNALDVKWTHALYEDQCDLIESEGLGNTYYEQVRRHPTLVLTQQKGVKVSQTQVRTHQKMLAKKIEVIERKVKQLPVIVDWEKKNRRDYGIDSKEAETMFTEIIGADVGKTSKGNISLDKANLENVKHPLAKHTVDFRHLTKMKSTYVDNFEKGVGDDVYPDGLTHSVLNSMYVATGRLSSEAWNMQNYIKHGEYKILRRQFIPGKGYALFSVDYGQIEARVIGMASQDKKFVQMLWENYDVHMEWAERLEKAWPRCMDHDSVEGDIKKLRQRVKNKFVFPAFFGAQRYSIADYMEMPEDVIEKQMKKFWQIFHGVKDWQDRLTEGYYEDGYVETLTGRRRRMPISRNQLINAPIQGTASDIVIDAMNRLSERGQKENKPQFQACLNIHDDLTFCLPLDTIEDDADIIINDMLAVPYTFVNVPIVVEVEMSERNWYEMEEVGTYSSDD